MIPKKKTIQVNNYWPQILCGSGSKEDFFFLHFIADVRNF
jgi:hypothetical protein